MLFSLFQACKKFWRLSFSLSSDKKRIFTMNVFYNGVIAFNVKTHKVGCFYFCPHFHQSFKKKQQVNQVSFLRDVSRNKIIAYCQSCKRKSKFLLLSDSYFQGAKKFMVQYILIVKNVKNKQTIENHGFVLLSGRNESKLIFVCRSCLHYFQGIFGGGFLENFSANFFLSWGVEKNV